MIDLGNSEICLVEQASTRYEDEEIEINTLDEKPRLKFRCLAGHYKSAKHQLKVGTEEEEREYVVGR